MLTKDRISKDPTAADGSKGDGLIDLVPSTSLFQPLSRLVESAVVKSRGGVEATGVSRKTAYDWPEGAGIASGWRRYDGKGEECVREYGRPSERLTMGIRREMGELEREKAGG